MSSTLVRGVDGLAAECRRGASGTTLRAIGGLSCRLGASDSIRIAAGSACYRPRVIREIGVTEEELAAYYGSHQDEFRLPPRVHLQHFLYRTQEKAIQALERLRKGATLAQLAEEKTSDADLLLVERRWFTPASLISELAEAAFRLDAGEVGEVIRSPYGYHLLRAEGKEPARVEEFAAARPRILDKVRQSKATRLYRQILEESRAKLNVRVHLDGPGP